MFITRIKYLIRRFFYILRNDSILVIPKKIYKNIFYLNKIDLDQLNIDKNLGLDDLFLNYNNPYTDILTF